MTNVHMMSSYDDTKCTTPRPFDWFFDSVMVFITVFTTLKIHENRGFSQRQKYQYCFGLQQFWGCRHFKPASHTLCRKKGIIKLKLYQQLKEGGQDIFNVTYMELKRSNNSYLRYIVCGEANSPVFVTHASFPRIPLRIRLFEIVWYFFWVFGEYPITVIEYRCQDIESKRKRCALYDCQVHILYSPKIQTRNQGRSKKTYRPYAGNAELIFLRHKVLRRSLSLLLD